MGNQQGNQQGDKGTNRATREPRREPIGETWQSDSGGDRVRTEGLRQRQGENGKDPTKLGIRETALKHRKIHNSYGFHNKTLGKTVQR